MPVEFLTDDQVAAYGRVPAELPRGEIERWWHFDDADRVRIDRRRRAHNRVGFGVQLGTVRMIGRLQDDPLDVPTAVLDYVAEQLGEDASNIKAYGQRPKTALEHTWEIRRVFGYRDYLDAADEFTARLDARAWTTGDGPKALFDAAVEWLRDGQVLLPGVTTLTRAVAGVRETATERLWAALDGVLTDARRNVLAGLLDVAAGERMSALERLRQGPRKSSGPQMIAALDRIDEVAHLGFVDIDLSAVPPRRVEELARHGLTANATALRRLTPTRRSATLLATVASLNGRAVDDALDVLDDLLATKLLPHARRESNKERLRSFSALAAASSRLAGAVDVLLTHADDNTLTVTRLWPLISASPGELAAAVTKIAELTPSPDSDLDEAWRAELIAKWRTVQSFVGRLTETITFGATPEAAPVLTAMRQLPTVLKRRTLTVDEIDTALLAGSWRRLVLAGPDREPGRVDRHAWVFCLLEQFHRHLLHHEIYAPHSTRWRDPRAKLLTGSTWNTTRDDVLASLQLPAEPEEHLADLADALDGTYRDVAARLDNTTISFDEDGRLHLDRLDALTEPETLLRLRDLTRRMLPRIDLPDLIMEVVGWTGLHAAFTSISGGRARLDGLDLTIAALLVAKACNIGLGPVAQNQTDALTRARLLHVDQYYLRAETIRETNRLLVEAQADLPLAQLWGGGLVAGIDGMRFVVPVASLHARPNPRYFGRRRGATWLNMLNDQAAGIANKVVAGTPRDSLHVIDVLYGQDGGPQPHMIVTDGSSYSDIVFGLLTMAGKLYAPALADLPDQRIWRIDPRADYGPFNVAARNRVNLEKIRRHWPDMLRIIGSIHVGAVRAHDVIRMLSRDGRPTALGDTFAHYGRIPKTLHILRLADDDTYRHQVKSMRNLQEGRHGVARKVFHGDEGELRQPYREGMEDQLGVLGLLLNILVLHNTRYLGAALDQLRRDGYPVQDADAIRLSPFLYRHVQMRGRYAFQRPRPTSQLRPLRDPSIPDDTDPIR